MANYLTDDAICLRVHDFSETSQIVGLFTRAYGLVPLIAKGSKRPSKKNTMSGPLDLLTSGEVVFILPKETPGGAVGGGAQLGTLTGWELVDHRRELRGSLRGLNGAMLAAELTSHLVQPLDPHPELFEELTATLDLLAVPAQQARIVVSYAKAALTSAGYWPQFGQCLKCRKPVNDAEIRFAGRAGGILCTGCHVDNAGPTVGVAGRIVAALDRLPLPTSLRTNPPEKAADEGALAVALGLLLGQVEMITDKSLRTRYLVRSLFASPAGVSGA